MRINLMIEGQEDVSWEQWLALARTCEDAGLEGLFRSDHYLSVQGAVQRGSLDAWTTLAALGAVTSRVRLGTLVSPVTFRHPSLVAKAVVTADHVSGGRVELGLGGGWHRGEHRAYGFDLPDARTRMELLAEQLEVVSRSWAPGPFDFSGRHYHIRGLDALPKPLQQPHPTLIVGGGAGPRSAALAARWADEYNTVFAGPQECRRRRAVVADAARRAGRDPDTLRFSLMTACIVGRDRAEAAERLGRALARLGRGGEDPAALLADPPEGWLLGTAEQVAEGLQALARAGVDRVMLQHLDHADLDMVALLGREIAPAVA